MKDEKEVVRKVIPSQKETKVPKMRKKISMSAEMKEVIPEPVQNGKLACNLGGYKVVQDVSREPFTPVYKPHNKEEKLFICALWECVKSGDASASLIQRRCSVDCTTALKAMTWMREHGFIGSYPDCEVQMDVEQYFNKFGNPNKVEIIPEDEDYKELYNSNIRRIFEYTGESDDVLKDMPKYYAIKEENGDHEVDIISALIDCFTVALRNGADDGKYALKLNKDMHFEFEFVHKGNRLRLSDGGRTLQQTVSTKRKIKNVLKGFAPVGLDGEEISITIEDPHATLIALLTLYAAIDAVKKLR